ncbi:MAG: DUF4410 domain-containing protein [Holophagaceae bacterium]|nr:DUF4410 domain-containing protein [Holophagaceae bacterium]
MRLTVALVALVSFGLAAQESPKAESAAPQVANPTVESAPVAPVIAAPKPTITETLDKGLLQMAWFGEKVAFAKGEDIDFYWIKPGTKLSGRTIAFKNWDDPVMLEKGRDGKDNSKAMALTDAMPSQIRGALSGAFEGKAKVSRTEGDLELIGRVVDCNAGSKAAKFMVGYGAGSATLTWDMKVVDAKTHELLMAVHHRVVSATFMSNLEDKVEKWSDKFARFLVQQTLR